MTGFIPAPIKPEITMDHLEKIDVRVGVVERVELVPASNKLVKLTVDFGDRRRTVLAGLRRERVTLKRKSKAVRRCLWLISQRVGWQVRFPRRCCSTSAMRMALHRCSQYRKSRYQTVRERDEWCFRSGAARVTSVVPAI